MFSDIKFINLHMHFGKNNCVNSKGENNCWYWIEESQFKQAVYAMWSTNEKEENEIKFETTKNGALIGKTTSMLFKDALCGNQSRKWVASLDESV